MHEPAARQDDRSIGSASQSHLLQPANPAAQTDRATPPNRRITADSFRALTERLKHRNTARAFTAPAAEPPAPTPYPALQGSPALQEPVAGEELQPDATGDAVSWGPGPEPSQSYGEQTDVGYVPAGPPQLPEPSPPAANGASVAPRIFGEPVTAVLPEPPIIPERPAQSAAPDHHLRKEDLVPRQPALPAEPNPQAPAGEPRAPSIRLKSVAAVAASISMPSAAASSPVSEMEAILRAVFGDQAATWELPLQPVRFQKPTVNRGAPVPPPDLARPVSPDAALANILGGEVVGQNEVAVAREQTEDLDGFASTAPHGTVVSSDDIESWEVASIEPDPEISAPEPVFPPGFELPLGPSIDQPADVEASPADAGSVAIPVQHAVPSGEEMELEEDIGEQQPPPALAGPDQDDETPPTEVEVAASETLEFEAAGELLSLEHEDSASAPSDTPELQPTEEAPQPPPELTAAPAPAPSVAPPAIAEASAARETGTQQASPPSLIRRIDADTPDPFAQAQNAAALLGLPQVEIGEPDPQAGDTARSLIDIMSASAAVAQPQERALAADTLLRLIPRVPEKALVAVAERVSMMDSPPPRLVTRLIRDPRPDVAAPILEKAPHIPDLDLIMVIGEGELAKQRMIARRRHISPALADALIATRDVSVLLTLIRNPGAAPTPDAFQRLCEAAIEHPSLQAPLVTRHDTPAPAAFELFWFLPPELRRFVLSRFLTDSENLNRILKIARAANVAENGAGDTLDFEFPDRQLVEDLVELLAEGKRHEAIRQMTTLAHICAANADRIIADEEGEPLTIVLKVLGLSRARFAEAIVTLQDSPHATLRRDRNAAELQSIFDSMSFNKARVLLTYWDWAAQKSGPYKSLAA